MYALNQTTFTHIFCGNYATANAQLDEVVALANEKGALRAAMRGRLKCARNPHPSQK